MKKRYFTQTFNRIAFIFVMLSSFTFSKAQELIPYQIDTTFAKTIHSLSEDGKLRTYCDTLEKRIYETAKNKAFFDFDYALLNYFNTFNKAGYSDLEKENALHRMYHILPELEPEFAYVLGNHIQNRFNRYNSFSMYAESKEWKLKDELITFEEVADILSIKEEIVELSQKGLLRLMSYQYPHAYSRNYTYLDLFFSFRYNDLFFQKEYELLYNYHKERAHWYEVIQLDMTVIDSKYYAEHIEKWNALDSLYQVYTTVPESEWILSEMYKITNYYALKKDCNLKKQLVALTLDYKERFDTDLGSNIDVIYHQLINPEFSVVFHPMGLDKEAKTFSVKSRNMDTLYFNIYSYENLNRNQKLTIANLNETKMTLVSSSILLLNKEEACFTEKYFLQEKLTDSDNYIFAWSDDVTFFDSLENNHIDSLHLFNYSFRTYTFDKLIAHEIMRGGDNSFHLLLRDKNLNLLEGVEVYAYGTKSEFKNGKSSRISVNKHLGKTDKNGVLSSKPDFEIDSLRFIKDDIVQIEKYRKNNYSFYDDEEKTPFFEKVAYFFYKEDRIDDAEFIIHTDRTKYKPGQTVHFKAIAYLLDDYDNLFNIVKNHPYEITVKDPNGKLIYSTEMKLNQWGSLTGQFEIPANSILGKYKLEINDWSDYDFEVEEYKEKRAKIIPHKIEELYKVGDSVRISGNVLTNTNTGIQNALITIYSGKEELGTTQSDSQGAFFFDVLLDTNAKYGYKNYEIIAILGSGEVLKESKSISSYASMYSMRFYKNEKTNYLYVGVTNNDNFPVPFENIQYKLKQYSKASAFHDFDPNEVGFTKEEYVRLLPNEFTFKNIEKVTIHQLKEDSINIKSFLEVYEEKRFELEFFYMNELGDTVIIKDYRLKDVEEYEGLPFTINQSGKIKGNVITTNTFLVLHKKNDKIVKSERLNQQEIEALNGSKTLSKYDALVIIDYKNRYLESIEFSFKKIPEAVFTIRPIEMEKELHPGEEYEFKFEILNKKGKRIKNAELLAYMCKTEFFDYRSNSYYAFLQEIIDFDYDRSWQYQSSSSYYQKETLGASLINSYNGSSKEGKKINSALIRNQEGKIYYATPLIMKDGGAAGMTITREDVARMPIRSASGIAAVVGGVAANYGDIDGGISVRGSRESATYYYIDGIQVRGSSDLPKSALQLEGELEEVRIVSYKIPENLDFRKEDMGKYQTPRKRVNFEETVFFQPKIRSNARGIYTVKFKQNDDINNFTFYLFGHTKKLQTGDFRRNLYSNLPVNIQVNKPRFIRERDEVVFKNALYNQTKDTLVGRVDFFLTAKDDSVALNKAFQTEFSQEVKIPPFSMKTVDWELVVPENSPRELNFVVQLLSNVGSDLYEDNLTVLNNRMENVVSLPFFKLNKISQDYTFDELAQIPESGILKEAFVYLDEDNTWNALKKFAEVMTKDYQVTNYQVAQLYAALMFKHLLASQAGLSEILAKHVGKIDQDKPKLLMSENPYSDFKGYGNEEEIILFMQQLTDTTILESFISKRVEELKLTQNSDGGFPWYKEGSSSIFITNYVFTTLNRLTQYNIQTDFDFKEKTGRYLDKFYEKNWTKAMFIGPSFEAQILWLMNKGKMDETTEKEIQKFEDELFSNWQEKDVFHKSLIGQLALKRGKIDVARKVRASLLDISRNRDDLGRIFEGLSANDQGKSIAATIRFLEKFNPNDEEIKNFGTGLRAQQAYTNNTSYLSALDYWDALLLSHKKEDLIQSDVVIRLTNKEEITFAASSDKVRNIPLDEIENLQQIQVESKKEDLVTGGVIVKYEDDIENIFKSSGDEIRIQRVIFLKEKGEYRRLKEGESLPLGTEIQVEINIINQEEMEYMHLIIPKATGMELSAEKSGFYWTQGFSYYVQLKNEVVDIFLERIPKGTSRVFFSAYLTSEGKLTMAPSTIQSFEHPALKASDTTFKIEVH